MPFGTNCRGISEGHLSLLDHSGVSNCMSPDGAASGFNDSTFPITMEVAILTLRLPNKGGSHAFKGSGFYFLLLPFGSSALVIPSSPCNSLFCLQTRGGICHQPTSRGIIRSNELAAMPDTCCVVPPPEHFLQEQGDGDEGQGPLSTWPSRPALRVPGESVWNRHTRAQFSQRS